MPPEMLRYASSTEQNPNQLSLATELNFFLNSKIKFRYKGPVQRVENRISTICDCGTAEGRSDRVWRWPDEEQVSLIAEEEKMFGAKATDAQARRRSW